MKITSFSLNNFAPEEFFGGGGQIGVNERSKILECDRTMKAFSFVERNKEIYTEQVSLCSKALYHVRENLKKCLKIKKVVHKLQRKAFLKRNILSLESVFFYICVF